MGLFNTDDLSSLESLVGGGKVDQRALAQPPQNAPIPQQAAPQPAPSAPPSAAQGKPGFADDFLTKFNSMGGGAAQQGAAAVPIAGPSGSSPSSAIDESPLSLMERAMMGWVRTPTEQLKYLKQHFDDAQLVQSSDSGATIAVKHGDKWFQANPNFEWKLDPKGAATGGMVGMLGGPFGALAGAAAGGFGGSLLDKRNLARGAGELAQFTGEYGLRAEASMAAGSAAFVAGTAAAAPLGPIAPLVGAGAGLLAAGAASAGTEAADLGSRAALMDPNSPGARPYKNADELNKEMLASAVFGAENFGLGKAIQFGAGKAADSFAKVVKSFGDTPEGHQAVRKILGLLGAKPEEIEARLMDPAQNASFDKMRAADNRAANPIGMGSLDKAQEGVADELHAQVNGVVKAQSGEFARMMKDPNVRNAAFDLHTAPEEWAAGGGGNKMLFSDAADELKQSQLIKSNGSINDLRVLGPGDKAAIDFVQNNLPTAKGVDYMELRARVADCQALLNQGISNPNLKRIVVGLKNGINQAAIDGLEDIKSGAGQRYGEIISKYADAKALQEELENTTAGQKRFTIAKKLGQDNPNATKQLMDSLVNAGIDPKTLVKFVQIQGSRNADSWFSNKSFLTKYLPTPGARLGAAGITAVSQAKDAVRQAASGVGQSDVAQAMVPYTHKAIQMMKGLPTDQLRSILTNPDALDGITGVISNAAIQEHQAKQQLVQQAAGGGGGGQ